MPIPIKGTVFISCNTHNSTISYIMFILDSDSSHIVFTLVTLNNGVPIHNINPVTENFSLEQFASYIDNTEFKLWQ